MENQLKTLAKVSLCVLFASTLTACGGGSSKSAVDTGDGATGGGGGAGSGGCVNFPRAKVGQIVKRELKDSTGKLSFSKSTEITAFSNTSISQHITGKSFGFAIDTTDIEEYTIANNYRDITKETVNASGFNSVTTYTPFKRIPIDKVCEGQTWTTSYTEKETGEAAQTITQTYTIEAINVSKTSPAGTFNTFRVKLVETGPSVNIVGKIWIDIDSGYDVLSEFSDSASGLGGTLELIEKNF